MLKLAGYNLPVVNNAVEHCTPEEAMDWIRSVVPRIIEAMALAPIEEGGVIFSKLDIKDGFWQLMCEVGKE